MSHALTKAQRLLQIESLLLAHPEGLTQAEISRRIGVARSTVYRYLPDLTEQFAVAELEDGTLTIDRERYLIHVRLNMHEALSVLLAARLLTSRTDRKNQHAATAIRKLALSMEGLAPLISEHILRSADVIDGERRRVDSNYIHVLEVLTRAWSLQRQVRLIHKHEESGESFSYRFCPYFIEPYAVGQSTFVLGYRTPPGALRTFKIERIEKIELLEETFTIPESFDPLALLSGAWGIWYTEQEPIEVVLRFSSRVASRVQESQWHHTERCEQGEDGSLVWRADVAQPLEMVPWIRGWGLDCEVLAPLSLRDSLRLEFQQLAALYQEVETSSDSGPPGGGVPPSSSSNEEPPEPVAHTPNASGEWHFFVEHARSVAALASSFAAPIQAEEAAALLGWWHDAGKLAAAWQDYLLQSYRGTWPSGRRGPEHAIIGFAALCKAGIKPPLGGLIACHHTGLKDFLVQWKEWLQKVSESDEIREATTQAMELLLSYAPLTSVSLPPLLVPKSRDGRAAAALGWRILHSCLVDADCLDTEAHLSPDRAALRGCEQDLKVLWDRLESAQRALLQGAKGDLNQRRASMYRDACGAAKMEPGFFSLSIPTGGGKTRTSMAFALQHALHHQMRRVIVAIPYTSIIEQNADVYRDILGDEAILEHHSSRRSERGDALSERRERLAAQNWDAPIVVTTNVQLLESLFAARNSKLRKLHRIPGSVIILDEVQTLPPSLLQPTVDALRYLVADFGCSVVFCTATQPSLTREVLGEHTELRPLDNVREIIEDPDEHFLALRRVRYHLPSEPCVPKDLASLVEAILSHPQALVICNTVKDAQTLLRHLGEEDGHHHLSTRLCGAHRRRVLELVRECLSDPAQPTCRLISTQVVEAGVDLDFPVVFRALGPLDSIIQAAGRCNREARREIGEVYIFSLPDASCPPGIYQTARDQTRKLLRTLAPEDLDQPKTCRDYFRMLYGAENVDKHGICALETDFAFASSAERYKLIEDPGVPILVRYPEALETIDAVLDDVRFLGELRARHWRLLQPFVVQLRAGSFERAEQEGNIRLIVDDLYEWTGGYHELYGLTDFIPSTQLIV